MFRLVYTLDGQKHARDLKEGTAILGRSAGCDVVIASPSVSGQHARLDIAKEGVAFRDLLSRNGTFLNGAKAEQGALRAGDTLRLGKVDLRLEADAPATAD